MSGVDCCEQLEHGLIIAALLRHAYEMPALCLEIHTRCQHCVSRYIRDASTVSRDTYEMPALCLEIHTRCQHCVSRYIRDASTVSQDTYEMPDASTVSSTVSRDASTVSRDASTVSRDASTVSWLRQKAAARALLTVINKTPFHAAVVYCDHQTSREN